MTPTQNIKRAILLRAKEFDAALTYELNGLTGEQIDALYERIDNDDGGSLQDARNEVREGDVETKLKCEYSRHYESKAVAAKMDDGSWVGWTFWYGGGKHGEPEAVDWMEEAYAVDCKEEERTVLVQTFSKS